MIYRLAIYQAARVDINSAQYVADRFRVRSAGLTQRAAVTKTGGVRGDAVSRQICKGCVLLLENERHLRRQVEPAEKRMEPDLQIVSGKGYAVYSPVDLASCRKTVV